MKNILVLIVLLACYACFTLDAALDSGQLAPEFTLTDSNGSEHSLSDFRGKYVVLEWTNHSCPFVVKHYKEGHMQAQQKAMTDKGVAWLQIVSSAEGKSGYVTKAEANQIRARSQIHSTAMLLDTTGEVGRAYDARVTPHMYLIGPEGLLIYQGAIDSIRSTRASDIEKAINYVRAAYESAVSGETIEHTKTTPYGCGIKY
ncbi:MAG: redoxin domain-containing protein [Verrucomicrobiota bacterium]|nr:redoxin domain-containing protein [Verrucomicrobiota bacterium]